jgi:hypothetical protein
MGCCPRSRALNALQWAEDPDGWLAEHARDLDAAWVQPDRRDIKRIRNLQESRHDKIGHALPYVKRGEDTGNVSTDQ